MLASKVYKDQNVILSLSLEFAPKSMESMLISFARECVSNEWLRLDGVSQYMHQHLAMREHLCALVVLLPIAYFRSLVAHLLGLSRQTRQST